MCGIAGIFSLSGETVKESDLKKFTDSMIHRGPDDYGYELLNNNKLGFGHRRLSILDLSILGKQPMSYLNGRFWITYNGEVFNFQEIRVNLIKKGYSFVSNSDTEVIIASYIEWGKECLSKFNGMWAFAIWDVEKKEIFLARDRFGIKPLYYLYEKEKRFAFASETRAFKYLSNFERKINNKNLDLNMKDPYALEGQGYTIFEQIYQLLPGHYLLINFDKSFHIQQIRWWHVYDYIQKDKIDFKTQKEIFYEHFKDACRIRLISDVPVATALSGGLDSTSVYSMVFEIIRNEHLSRTNKDMQRAFIARFLGSEKDESGFAKIASEYTGGSISFIDSDEFDLINRIEKETELVDFINSFPITSISSVYKGMRNNGIRVSLDGHGVDEMMYGYRDMIYGLYNNSFSSNELYKSTLINMYHPDFRNEISTKLESEKLKYNIKSSFMVRWLKKFKPQTNIDFPLETLSSLSNDPYNFIDTPFEERILYTEFFCHTLPSLLRNFDRASMINSIEIRMPFMDWRLVSFVFSLPISSKLNNGFTKYLLRETMKGRMDESLRTRTYKIGISSPIDTWINGPLKEWAMEKSNTDLKQKAEMNLKRNGIISSKVAKEIWQNINLDLIT